MKKRVLSLTLIACLLVTCLCGCTVPRTEIWEWEDSSLTVEIPVYWVEPMDEENPDDEELYLENALDGAVMLAYVYALDEMEVTYTPEELFEEQTAASLEGENVTQKGERAVRPLPGNRTVYEEFYTDNEIDYYCVMVYSGKNEAIWMMFMMDAGNDLVMEEAVQIAESATWNGERPQNDTADEVNSL